MAARYPNQSQLINSRAQFEAAPFTQHDQPVNQIQNAAYDNRVGLALGPFDDWSNNRNKDTDDFLSEEEIRMRSHEMLENEDMQHLLRLFSMGGHASVNVPEDGFGGFSSYMPTPSPGFSYGEDRARSGKAVAGWLKIKAAMRWGIFIRKKAAERRARLVELDDE